MTLFHLSDSVRSIISILNQDATTDVDKKFWQKIQEWEAGGECVLHAGVAKQKELVGSFC